LPLTDRASIPIILKEDPLETNCSLRRCRADVLHGRKGHDSVVGLIFLAGKKTGRGAATGMGRLRIAQVSDCIPFRYW